LWGCTTEVLLPMCLLGCFEAGRFTQIQSSWTALTLFPQMDVWSRDPLAQSVRDRTRPIAALSVEFIRALQILLGSAGRSVFSLDKSLSWMPHVASQ
jgi:hypothetical protein